MICSTRVQQQFTGLRLFCEAPNPGKRQVLPISYTPACSGHEYITCLKMPLLVLLMPLGTPEAWQTLALLKYARLSVFYLMAS